MKIDFQRYLIKLFNNLLGRWYLGVPKGKKIYKITQSSVHYYTGELSKRDGQPIICTGNCSPNGKFVFNRIMKLAKVVSVFAFIPLFPKNLLPLVALTDTGLKSPTGTGGGSPDDMWTNPANAYSSNNVYATRLMTNSFAYQSYHGFGFGISSGIIINGIEVSIEHYMSGTPGNNGCRTTLSTDNKATPNGYCWAADVAVDPFPTIQTSEGIDTAGGSTSKWGELDHAWTYSDFTDANFAVEVSIRDSEEAGRTFYCDHIQVKVYYTESSSSSSSSSFSSSCSSSFSSSCSSSFSSSSSSCSSSFSSSCSSSFSSSCSSSFSSSSSNSSSSSSSHSGFSTCIDVDLWGVSFLYSSSSCSSSSSYFSSSSCSSSSSSFSSCSSSFSSCSSSFSSSCSSCSSSFSSSCFSSSSQSSSSSCSSSFSSSSSSSLSSSSSSYSSSSSSFSSSSCSSSFSSSCSSCSSSFSSSSSCSSSSSTITGDFPRNFPLDLSSEGFPADWV